MAVGEGLGAGVHVAERVGVGVAVAVGLGDAARSPVADKIKINVSIFFILQPHSKTVKPAVQVDPLVWMFVHNRKVPFTPAAP